MRAINVEYEDLDRWKDYVSMGEEEGRNMLLEKESGDSVLIQVARMRGWS